MTLPKPLLLAILALVVTPVSGEISPSPEAAPVRPAMSRPEIEAGLESHDKVLYIKEGWVLGPYVTPGPDEAQKF